MSGTAITLQEGDIFLTRNTDQVGNPTPGHWNHAAIFVGGTKVVEAQVAPYNRVIVSEWEEFWNRYPEMLILRSHPAVAAKMALMAVHLVGQPYRKGASFWRNMRQRFDNCVTVIRKSFKFAAGFDPRWKRPDHILYSAEQGMFSWARLK